MSVVASAGTVIDTIDVSRPPPATRLEASVSALGNIALAVLLVLIIPLVLTIPFAALSWAIQLLVGHV
jgi:hypothetical protein